MVNFNNFFDRLLGLCIISVAGILLTVSCAKDDVSVEGETALIAIKISQSAFENASNVKNLASINGSSAEALVPWDKDRDLLITISNGNSLIRKIGSNTLARTINTSYMEVGIHYRVLIFDGDDKFLLSKDYVVGKNENDYLQLSSTETYSFIAYSFGLADNIAPTELKKGDSIKKATLQLSGREDLMLASARNIKLNVGNNNIGLVLKHLFTKVDMTINSDNVGEIESVGVLSVSNSYGNASVDLGNQNGYPKNLKFSNLLSSTALHSFDYAASKNIVQSLNNIFYTDSVQTNTLTLSKLKIDGVEKQNIELYNLVGKPGVSYTITLTLKKKSVDLDGYNDGVVIWGIGNLIKTADQKYSFATSQGDYGDYWFRDTDGKVYSNPLNLVTKAEDLGVKIDDICSEVGEGWRLPTQDDILRLEKLAKWYENPSNKYYGSYTKKDGSKVTGAYIGTSSLPAVADQDKYLFLPAAGAYNSGNPQEIGVSCFYWHAGLGKGSDGTSYQIASSYISTRNNGGLDSKRANTLRCVRDVK